MKKKAFIPENIDWIVWRGMFWETLRNAIIFFTWGAANVVMDDPEQHFYIPFAYVFFAHCFYLTHRICYATHTRFDKYAEAFFKTKSEYKYKLAVKTFSQRLRLFLSFLSRALVRLSLLVLFLPMMVGLINILTPYRWLPYDYKLWFYQYFILWWA